MTTNRTDARLIYSANESDADMLWAARFFVPEPFIIHEAPINARHANRLRTGHAVTVEPGLYYMGMGGVRLEGVVLVPKAGCTHLVNPPRTIEV